MARTAELQLDVYSICDLPAVRSVVRALLAEAGFDLRDPRLLITVDGGDLLSVSAITRDARAELFTPAWREEVHLRVFRTDPSAGVRLSVRELASSGDAASVAG